jgi:predicted deacylase
VSVPGPFTAAHRPAIDFRRISPDPSAHNGAVIFIISLLTLVTIAARTAVAEQSTKSIRIGELGAVEGRLVTGRLEVPPRADPGTFIPISIATGTRPGPVLALVAGVHGSEFSPILALQRLPARIDSSELAGTVILVHVANIPSFLGRTIYTGPVDGKNLNRLFPGSPDGTLSERIAHVLTSEVLAPADIVVDIHSGDANEDLRPWTGYYANFGSPEVIARSRDLAVAFGIDYIVQFPFVPEAPDRSTYTGAAAVSLGKASFDVEVGRLGLVEPGNVERIVEGLLSVMRHLRMIDGEPAPSKSPWFIERRVSVTAEEDGIFHPVVTAGEFVRAGMPMGRVTDFHASPQQDLRAPETGVILGMIASPPVRKGDTLVTIGVASSP